MSIKYEDLQPHVEMLIDALENKGASSSGIPDTKVYPYAQKYREILSQIRNKELSKYYLDRFLNSTYDEIMSLTTQSYRVKCLLAAIKIYFYKEFMRKSK
jgi:hypothetical protein